jgi:hypothetical protein
MEPGLTDFFVAAPAVDGETNLEPYLFLAQTSLSRNQSVGIATIDEKTKHIVSTIRGADRVLSVSAAKRAVQDPTVAAAVLRQLAVDLGTAKDPVSITNMLGGIETIAKHHPDFFKLVLKPLGELDANNPAISLAASTLLNAAEKAGTDVPNAVKEGSRIAEALIFAGSPPSS